MTEPQIRFDDCAGYERYMGKWSQAVGQRFLDWLTPERGWRWLDVGCGNGAFTEMLLGSCSPVSVVGIDPSEAQLAFARRRFAHAPVDVQQADAMALPFEAASFDAAVMPLVIFFVPEPARGVAEMVRVVRPGGLVCAYAWDMPGAGFPYAVLVDEMRAVGAEPPKPPSPDASHLEVLDRLWSEAGLADVRTSVITVERTFDDFADYWETALCAPSAGTLLKRMDGPTTARLQEALRRRLMPGPDGRITCRARAHAVSGRVA